MRKLRIAVLMHPTLVPPAKLDGFSEKEINDWKTEYDVVSTLRGLGHEVEPLGVQDELGPIRDLHQQWQPHIFFNLLEEFHGMVEFDHHVVSFLELLQASYTGCGPRGLVLSRDKGLAKKVIAYHRIRIPAFAVFARGRKVKRPARLSFPLIVKSLSEEASVGISQASIVDSDEKLVERVRFIHDSVGTDALVEQFIEGRELYVCLLGNNRLKSLPVWELGFENLPAGAAAIATANVKHNPDTQRRWGIVQHAAQDLPPAVEQQLLRTSRRVYKLLGLDGYGRLDYRLSANGEVYFLEANPNPEIAQSEEFASAAESIGIHYPQLLETIVKLGLSRRPPPSAA
jgi:D-alanine-D-alanine ligase